MGWTQKDLENLKIKGITFKIQTKSFAKRQSTDSSESEKPAVKKTLTVQKISVEKNTIGFVLISLKQNGLITDFVTEHKFDDVRRFRFDWAIIDLKIGIEYEGIISEKSRHTTIEGFTTDCIKYNLAIQNGWRVLRYTAGNYKDLEIDLLKLIKN